MNNYCTNCGAKLKTYDTVCKSCNTPILDIPFEYKHASNKTKKIKKTIWITLLSIVVIIVAFFVLRSIYINTMSEKLKNKYLIPYLTEKYGNNYSDVRFDMYGKCIISGECYTKPLISCDGNDCELYEYLSRFKCMSFFYYFMVDSEIMDATVYKKDGKYNVVIGRNIYGEETDIYDDEDYEKDLETYYDLLLPYESPLIDINQFDSFLYEYNTNEGDTIYLDYNNDIKVLTIVANPNEILDIIKIKVYDFEKNEFLTYDIQKNYSTIDLSEETMKIGYIKVLIGEEYE